MLITSPRKFASLFNEKYIGANRQITVEDVICMTSCKLICRHDYYLRDDLEIVRGVLEYEQMREQRSAQEPADNKLEPPKCKMCGQPLPPHHVGKRGRPLQYCQGCQSSRAKERYRKWRKRKALQVSNLQPPD